MNINDMTKEVGKMYTIKETQEWWDDSKDICIMNSKEQCDEIVAELNKEYNSVTELEDTCENCVIDTGEDVVEEDFTLRNTCGRHSLKSDRNGFYCEGNVAHSKAMYISYYYVAEVSIRERI